MTANITVFDSYSPFTITPHFGLQMVIVENFTLTRNMTKL